MKFRNLTAMALAASFLSAGCSANPVKPAQGRIYTYESDASGFNTKTFFYDNGEEVVAFDAQFTLELAEKAIAYLRTQSAHPITYLVITHPNPDKFNGLGAFQKVGAKVIASSRTAAALKGVHEYKKYYFVQIAKMFTDETYPKLGQVDTTFEQGYDLRLGNGESISLRELSEPGVSSNQTIATIPAAQAVVVGDLVHHGVHAWLEGGIVNGKPTPTLKGWVSDLNELQALYKDAPETIVYGGRGEAVRVGDAVTAQIDYLNRADEIVTDYVTGLGARKPELQGAQAAAHYQAIRTIFESAFPSYGLGYMIQYGVYGWVNSK